MTATESTMLARARKVRTEREEAARAAAARQQAQHTESLQRRGAEEARRVLGVPVEPTAWVPLAGDDEAPWDPRRHATAAIAGETFILDTSETNPLRLARRCERHGGELAVVGPRIGNIAQLADAVDEAEEQGVECWRCSQERYEAAEEAHDAAQLELRAGDGSVIRTIDEPSDEDTIAQALVLGIRAMIQQEIHDVMLAGNRAAIDAELEGGK